MTSKARKDIITKLILISIAILIQTSPSHQILFTSSINNGIWFVVVFFHEIGHQLAVILTGGKTHVIMMGGHGGLAASDGGVRGLVIFGGFAFPPLLGAILYYILNNSFLTTIKILPIFWVIFIFITGAIWVRDLLTFLILFGIFWAFLMIAKLECHHQTKKVLQFLAIYLIVQGFTGPYYQAYIPNSTTDNYRLAQILGTNSQYVVYYWWAWASLLLLICLISDYIMIFKVELIEDLGEYEEEHKLGAKKDTIIDVNDDKASPETVKTLEEISRKLNAEKKDKGESIPIFENQERNTPTKPKDDGRW